MNLLQTEPSRILLPSNKVKDFRITGVWDGSEHHFGCGIGVYILSDKHPNCVLLGLRRGSTGEGTWALPGGHVEFGEELEKTAVREVYEETGIEIEPSNAKVIYWDNAIDLDKNYHYVTGFVVCNAGEQEPTNLEPNKCDGWEWRKWDQNAPDALPESISSSGDYLGFPPLNSLFTALRNVRRRGQTPDGLTTDEFTYSTTDINSFE
jgi:8-oxo-dGTP diphosphatase